MKNQEVGISKESFKTQISDMADEETELSGYFDILPFVTIYVNKINLVLVI
jgi:hypothetical protein